MLEADDIPGNANTNEIDLNNGGWILIALLICIIVILAILFLIMHLKNQKTINKLQEFSKNELSEEERNLLMQYRKLNNRDKSEIISTISSLNKNNEEENLTKQ